MDQAVCLRTYTGEEQRSQSSIHNLQNLILDEDAEDAENNQDDKTDKEHAVTGGEVIFGLRGKDKRSSNISLISVRDQRTWRTCKRQGRTDTNLQRENDHCEAHKRCDAHRHDHGLGVVEGGNHSHHVGQTESQDGLKTQNTVYQQHTHWHYMQLPDIKQWYIILVMCDFKFKLDIKL